MAGARAAVIEAGTEQLPPGQNREPAVGNSDAPAEAAELERAADWRIRKLGENPSDQISAAAATLLQLLADEVRGLCGSPAYTEHLAILNWLGEFDVMGDFAKRALEYRMGVGVEHFPANGEAYLRALTALAKDVAGA